MSEQKEIIEGLSAKELFLPGKGVTYDGFIINPGIADFAFSKINLKTQLTRNIAIQHGLVGAPMDTVAEDRAAIAFDLEGCFAIKHYNNTIDEQARMVGNVKAANPDFINEPKVLPQNATVADLKQIKKDYGFSSVPVTVDGTLDSKVIGLLTSRHARNNDDVPVEAVMHPAGDRLENLTTAPEGTDSDRAQELMIQKNRKRLLIVDDLGRLKGLVTAKDLDRRKSHPHATVDSNGRLLAGAAVSSYKEDKDRIDALVDAGVDVLCLDTAQAAKKRIVNQAKYIKDKYSHIELIVGNIATIRQAKWLYNQLGNRIDAWKVGMGVGSICTTPDVAGAGAAQAAAVYRVSLWNYLNSLDIPVMADGGIRGSGDVVKALACGAKTIVAGSLFAGTAEAPGEYVYEEGVRLKKYRGMGSIEAQREGGEKRYRDAKEQILVSQGVPGFVQDKGSLHHFLPHIIKAIKLGFEDIGYKNINDLRQAVYNGARIFEERTAASLAESKPHNLVKYREEPIGGK
ncbi:MAG: IMP dehydrogenase [Nanoarchaeota archaeon]|nr:IMP dehydrogenase [Nanoarchaeota archaeon]